MTVQPVNRLPDAGPDAMPEPGPAPGSARRVRYRVSQFARGLQATLRPGLAPGEAELVAQKLPPAAVSLFAALPGDAQRHSLNVLQTLAQGGEVSADLAAAALLHDVGKLEAARAGAPIGLWLRGPLVLAAALAPAQLARAARATPAAGWRYTLWVQLEHARLGAQLARAAGCSEATCRLILHHADAPLSPVQASSQHDLELRRLQWADNSN